MNHLPEIRWVLRGLGAAGKARQKGSEEVSGLRLMGIVSRRREWATLSWDQALRDPSVDAVAISTENTDHPGAVEAALLAKKHVLCDYPLAWTAQQARKLYQLAQRQNRLLHVEHIGLLTEEHLKLKTQAKDLGKIQRGDYVFQGGWNPKLADPNRSGPAPILVLSRLLQIADLFGAFTLTPKQVQLHDKGFFLHLHLNFPHGGTLGFTEDRMEGLPRRRSFSVECEQGPLVWKAGVGSGGLFAQDLAWFRDRIRENKPCYYDEERMIHLIGELEKIKAPGPPAKAWEK